MFSLGVTAMKHHEQYYLKDGDVCFVVEGTTFRLHRHFFERESAYFREKLSTSTKGDVGSIDTQYVIEDVKVDEFAKFVWVWYNPQYSFSRKGKDHWLIVLKLATQWEFQEIRNLAIRQLERLDLHPIEKISLYKEYNVNPELLLPSYVTLCRSEKLPSPAEGRKLSLDTVLRLAEAREKILLAAMDSDCKTPTTASTPDGVTRRIIAELFELTPHPNDRSVTGMASQSAVNNGNVSGDAAAGTETAKQAKKGKTPTPSLSELAGVFTGKARK